MHELELDRETMRRIGYAVVDRLVDWQTTLPDRPVLVRATRAETETLLREPAPEDGVGAEGFDALLDQLLERVIPLGARVDHPRFFAFVPGNATWPGVMGDLVAAGTNVFQGTWLASAGVTQMEMVVVDWFKEWIGYPAQAEGILVSGGSNANLTALACARQNRFGGNNERGRIYLSRETHSSVQRGARVLGLREEQVRIIDVDSEQRILLPSLRAALAEDRANGLEPFFVVANGGTTSTGSVDPLNDLADLCRDEHMWLHVDAAYGGFAVLSEQGRQLLHGIERADSVTLDPHKWLYQPFEAGCLLVRDGVQLRRAFLVMADYLRDTAVPGGDNNPVNFAERGIQLTRYARAIKIWLSLHYFGVDAFRNAIDRAMEHARYAQQLIDSSPSLELVTPARFGIVCFRRTNMAASGGASDATAEGEVEAVNERLAGMLSDSGLGMISSTRVNGRYSLRLCILSYRTTREDVERVVDYLATADVR